MTRTTTQDGNGIERWAQRILDRAPLVSDACEAVADDSAPDGCHDLCDDGECQCGCHRMHADVASYRAARRATETEV